MQTFAAEELLRAISNQRHEFLNHLQVIWGYLNLKKEDKALEYLLQVIEYLETYRELNNIKPEKLAAFFMVNALELGNKEALEIRVPEICLIREDNIPFIEVFCTEFFSLVKNNMLQEIGKIKMELLKERIIISLHNKDKNCYDDFQKNLLYAAEKNSLLCKIEENKLNININYNKSYL